MRIDKNPASDDGFRVPRTDNNFIVQYRFSGLRLSLGFLIDVSDTLVAVLGYPNASANVVCNGQTFNGDMGEFRQQSSVWEPNEIAVFTLTISTGGHSPNAALAQVLNEQIVAKKAQMRQLVQAPQSAQRAALQEEVRQLQAQVQNSAAEVQFIFNVNAITQHLSFSGSPTASTACAVTPQGVDAAVKLLEARIPRAFESADALASKAVRLESEVGQLDERLLRIRQVTAEGIALLPSVQGTLDHAANARAAAAAAESEATRLRQDVELELGKAKELQGDLAKGQTELARFVNAAAVSAGQMEKKLAESMSKAQGLVDSIASRAEMATQSFDHWRDQSAQFGEFIRVSRESADLEVKKTIEGIEKGIPEWNDKFKAVFSDSESKRDQIHQLLGASVAANLSSAFRRRQIELEKGRSWWFVGIVVVTVIITVASYCLLSNGGISTTLLWLQRTIIILPLIFLDLFFLGQYKRKMLLADQFAFKATVAASFDYYKEELVRSSVADSKTAEFVAQTIGRLWAEPNNVTELSGPQIRRFTKMLETLGVTAIKEGSAVTKAALQARGISEDQPHDPPRSIPAIARQVQAKDTPTSERSP